MENNTLSKIFISYASANIDLVDEVYNDFRGTGITLQRDVRDVTYSGGIMDLMGKIGEDDFVMILISDEYLKSENCMYEISRLTCAPEFNKRLLPVMTGNAPISSAREQEKYYYYWQDRVEEANRVYSIYQTGEALEDKKKIQSIYDHLGIFFQRIDNIGIQRYDQLRAQNYRQLLSRVEFLQDGTVGAILELSKIADPIIQETTFLYLWVRNPNSAYVLFQCAYRAQEQYQYDKARQRYEALLWQHPGTSVGHYHYALLLKNHFAAYKEASDHYETALRLNPYDAEVHQNYAILLATHFSLYDEAKKHYEKAMELNPQNAETYNNYALLLAKHFSLYDDALAYLEMAIELDSQYANAHNNLGCLLETYFKDYKQAKVHYEIAIRLSRKHDLARTNLATLLKNHFS